MKCPNCEHQSEAEFFECSHCGERYEREPLQLYQHLEYLLEWLEGQAETVDAAIIKQLQTSAAVDHMRLRETLQLPPPRVLTPATPEKLQELGLLEACRRQIPRWVYKHVLGESAAGKLSTYFTDQIAHLRAGFLEQPSEIATPSYEEVMAYALRALESWAEGADLHPEAVTRLRAFFQEQLQRLSEPKEVVKEPEVVDFVASPELARQLALLLSVHTMLREWFEVGLLNAEDADKLTETLTYQIEAIQPRVAKAELPLPEISMNEKIEFADQALKEWGRADYISQTSVTRLQIHLQSQFGATSLPEEMPAEQPAPAVEPMAEPVATAAAPPEPAVELQAIEAVVASQKAPAPPVKAAAKPQPRRVVPPKAPPKPRQPLVEWDKLWGKVVEAAVSGLLLRWLRYLGAFLFVASLAIVVVSFWDSIPQWGQVAIIFFVPTAFYGGGWFIRARLKLEQSGTVFMGIGQLLLAIDFAAIYQFGGLTVDLGLYWLITSSLCTLVYLLTAWLLVQTEFFGYITLAGLASTTMAVVAVSAAPLEWIFVALAGVCVPMSEGAYQLAQADKKWSELSLAARRFPLILLPAALTLILFVPGEYALTGQALGFALATTTFGILALRFPHLIYVHLAVWGGLLTTGLTLRALSTPWEWYAAAAAALTLLYALIERTLHNRVPAAVKLKPAALLAFRLAGSVLLIGSILLGFATTIFELWPGVIALFAASLVLGLGAFLYRQPLFGLAAAGLLAAPYTLAVVEWLAGTPQRLVWVTVAWVGLGLVYLGTAAGLRKLPRYMRWTTLIGQGLGLLAVITLGFIYLLPGTGSSIPILVSLGALLAFYLASAVLHDSGKHPALSTWLKFFPVSLENALFLYPIGVLTPAGVYVAWMGSVLVPAWMGVALAGLALGYIGLGQLLLRRKPDYRFPFHLLGYLVGALGVLAAAQNDLALVTTLYINVLVLIAAAVLYKRPIDTAVAGLMLLWPFQITLDLLRITPHAHALAYALLAGVGFVPLGLWVRKRVPGGLDLDLPILIIGYAISGYALLVSLLGRFGGFSIDVPWIGMLVPTLLTVLYVFSAYVFRRVSFAWAAAAVLPIAYGQGLTLLRIPPDYDAGAWILLGTAYLLGVSLIKSKALAFNWLRGFRLPLRLGAWFLTAFGLLQTALFTLNAFFGNVLVIGSTTLNPVLLAQGLAVFFVVLAAVLGKSRWPLFLEPALAYFSVTLVFIGYGPSLFGQDLHPAHFGIVWAGLGALHVGAGAILDRVRKQQDQSAQPIPYAHGIYLGGYLLGLLAVFWNILWWQADTQAAMLWSLGIWVLVAAGSALLTHFKQHLTWREGLALVFSGKPVWKPAERIAQDAFLWLASWPLPIWVTLLLWQFKVVPAFSYLGYGSTALVFLGLAFWLRRVERSYTWPLLSAGQFYVAFSLLLSIPLTARFLSGNWRLPDENLTASGFILVQLFGVAYYALSGRVFRRQWIGYFLPYLAAILLFFPYTLGWIAFGRSIFGRPIFQAEFGVAWMGLSLALLALAYLADRQRLLSSQASRPDSTERMDIQGRWLPGRYAHALYFVGYGLAVFAANWVIGFWGSDAQAAFLWTIGLVIAGAVLSALLIHFNLHSTWEDWLRLFFGDSTGQLRSAIRGIFLWPAAWLLPVWATVLLWNLRVIQSFGYLGYGVTAIGFLGLAFWLRRVERSYTWPLLSAGHFYTVLGLSISARISGLLLSGWGLASGMTGALGFILLQSAAVVFYAGSSRYFRRTRIPARLFAYIATLLTLVPYTLGWIVYWPEPLGPQFAYPWMAWAVLLLGTGFGLDWAERRRHTRLEAGQGGKRSEGRAAAAEGVQPALRRIGYAHGPFAGGYLLMIVALIRSWGDPLVDLYTLAAALLVAGISQVAVHYRWHDSFEDFVAFFWRRRVSTVKRVVQTGFLFLAAYGFPVWLAKALAYNDVTLAWRGLALALVAPLYIALGLTARRARPEYTWPLYSAGYALTAVGAMVSFENQLLATYVLSLNAVVYGVSAYIFRQSAWLYLSTALVPIIGLMTLDNALNALPAEWVAGMFMGLAFVYIAIGRIFDWRTAAAKLRSGISTYALAFYAPGFLLSALALAVASVQRELAIGVYLAGVLLYGLCAWSFREALFLYPAVWLTAVPTYLGLTYTRLDPNWYGLGWLPLIAGAILIGRFVFDRPPRERLKLFAHLSHPRMPFYLLGYALSLSMLFIARFDMAALTAACLAAAGIYFGSTWLFRHPGWLYPGLAALHLGLITYFAIDPAGYSQGYIALPLHVLTWVVTLLAGVLWRARDRREPIKVREQYRLWALPFVIFAGLDLVVWQAVALVGPDTGVILAGGHMLLLGILAILLLKRPLAWGALGFLTLGIALRLYWLGQPLPILAAVLAGAGFGLYLAGRLIETLVDRLEEAGAQNAGWTAGLSLWGVPLTWVGVGLNALGAVATLFTPLSFTSQTAAGLAFAGALYLAVAYRGHYYRLGYAAIAALEVAFVLVLIRWDIREPQWYGIPAGLYFTGIGVFERRQGRQHFALLVETFGLMVLLLTSFIQSLNLETGFVYFLLLLVEGLLVAGWGAQQRRKIPFLIGLSASVFNVIGQVVVLLLGGSLLIRWLIFGGVGLLLLVAAIFAERWIIPRAQDLRERLEAWA